MQDDLFEVMCNLGAIQDGGYWNVCMTREAKKGSARMRCWPSEAYAQLAHFLQNVVCKRMACTAMALKQSTSNFMRQPLLEDLGEASEYSLLQGIDLPLLREQALQLLRLNELVLRVLPLVDFACTGQTGSLAQLIAKSRGLILTEVKFMFIDQVLRETAMATRTPSLRLDRILASGTLDRPAMQHARGLTHTSAHSLSMNTVVGQTYAQLRGVASSRLRPVPPRGAAPHVALNVTFVGEKVLGQAGPYRAFFDDFSRELHESQGADDPYPLPLFLPTPNNVHKLGENRDKLQINPSSSSFHHLELFELVGKIIGIAMRTRVLLPLRFSSSTWKLLCGEAIMRSDLRKTDTSLVDNVIGPLLMCTDESQFKKLFCFEDSDENQVCSLAYPITDSNQNMVGARTGPVDWAQAQQYATNLENARLLESARQVSAIRKGLGQIIPLQLLQLLQWDELELRVGGCETIDVELLRRNTQYSGGLTESMPHIQWFWTVLTEFSQ
jgi:E3 ubiquitin-protein ligase HERC2